MKFLKCVFITLIGLSIGLILYLGSIIRSSSEYERLSRLLRISVGFEKNDFQDTNTFHENANKEINYFINQKKTDVIVNGVVVNSKTRAKLEMNPTIKLDTNPTIKAKQPSSRTVLKQPMISNTIEEKPADHGGTHKEIEKSKSDSSNGVVLSNGKIDKAKIPESNFGMSINDLSDENIRAIMWEKDFDLQYIESLLSPKRNENTISEETNESSSLGPALKFYPLNIIWVLNVDRDSASRGIIYESFDFLLPLSRLIDNIGWWPNMDHKKLRENDFLKDLNEDDQEILIRLCEKGDELKRNIEHEDTVVIVSEHPSTYDVIFEEYGLKHAVYKVGRLMFETTSIPHGWSDLVNTHLDEVWVPSYFAKDIFLKAGVKTTISVIHEGFDADLFSKQITPSLKRVWRKALYPNCAADDLILLTVGKMEERKGIDILELSFSSEFRKDRNDKACLYIRSATTDFNQKIIHYLNTREKHVYMLDKLSKEDLVIAYQVADLFVLPTHGEGWGRPIMEAMAAGMPVLTTFWSGPTEYLSPDYAILIHVDNLEVAYPHEPYLIGGEEYRGEHRWAEINVFALSKLLRWCYNNRDRLPEIGRKARAAMFRSFTRDRVAVEIDMRISQIIKWYLLRTKMPEDPTVMSFFEDIVFKFKNSFYNNLA